MNNTEVPSCGTIVQYRNKDIDNGIPNAFKIFRQIFKTSWHGFEYEGKGYVFYD